MEVLSQNDFNFGMNKFNFKNYDRKNIEYTSFDSISDFKLNTINQQIKEITGCFYQSISFVKAQKIETGSKFNFPNFKKYYNKKFDDERNFIYNLPAYELIFVFHDFKINQYYYFNIYTDLKGKIIGNLDFPRPNKTDCNLIDIKTAISVVENKWKNKKDKLLIKFGYYKKQKCFGWGLTRLIEQENNGYLGTTQTFIINAQSGKIVKHKKEKLLYE